MKTIGSNGVVMLSFALSLLVYTFILVLSYGFVIYSIIGYLHYPSIHSIIIFLVIFILVKHRHQSNYELERASQP